MEDRLLNMLLSEKEIQGQKKWCGLIGVLLLIMMIPLFTAYLVYVSATSRSTAVVPPNGVSSAITLECKDERKFTTVLLYGTINFFGWVVVGTNLLYLYVSKPTWTNFFGWTEATPQKLKLSHCIATGIALLLINWGYQLLKIYSANMLT